MSVSTATSDPPASSWLSRQWHNWKRRRDTIDELALFDDADRERLAHDIGVSQSEFCVLAGRWPQESTLLSQRLAELNLDANKIADGDPTVLRDLERVCGLCTSKRECRHDLAAGTGAAHWQDYCPNAYTIRALLKERSS